MSDPRRWTIEYLAARADSPWRWADDGNVIAWADGTTIAYREEVAFVLEWLAPHGWPPFGALVWLLAACRGKLPPSLESDSRQLSFGLAEQLRGMHFAVEKGLARIAGLPEPLRTSSKAKAVLAEMILGGEPTRPGVQATLQDVVHLLRSGELTDTMLNLAGAPPREGRGEFATLHEGLIAFDPDAVALRMKTGLDALPAPPALPALPAARLRTLLADLRTDPELEGLARLTRDFMAALQLPRLLSEPDEMPLGGFADLSNRGNLDRLLLSELAHDDLTLAVRIALQEALYLRREPPARQPPSTLAILLDSGIRLWGVPRLLATAVALALIGKSAHHESVSVFRANGAELAAVDLLTREGLATHLAILDTRAHPGLALEAFARTMEKLARRDAVLITQRDVLLDAGFRRLLAAAKLDGLYLAVVDRDGSFELLRATQPNAPLCRAQVNVEDLLPAQPSPEKKRRPLVQRAANPELPLFFSVTPRPLLVSVRGRLQATVATKGGDYFVMHDRRLLHCPHSGQGAQTIATDLPRGSTLWLGGVALDSVGVVKVTNGRRHLACRIFNELGALVQSHDWTLARPVVRAEALGRTLYVICSEEAHAYDLETGDSLGSTRIYRRFSHGRYFRGHDHWSLLVWDGQSLKLEPVSLPASVLHGSVIRVFNRRGREGPWCLTRSGHVYSGDGECILRLGPLREVASVSPDGLRLLVATAETGKTELVNLLNLQRTPLSTPLTAREWNPLLVPPIRNVQYRFLAIHVSEWRIQLVSRKGEAKELMYRNERLELATAKAALDFVPFQRVEATAEVGGALAVAEWPDGRRAWIDENGMLHLRCADPRRPEVSIVLSDQGVAAWCSDALWHGPAFFIGDQPQSHPLDVWERIIPFLA